MNPAYSCPEARDKPTVNKIQLQPQTPDCFLSNFKGTEICKENKFKFLLPKETRSKGSYFIVSKR